MIDFYYAPTPNGWKVAIMLFELDVPFRVRPLSLPRGDQLSPEFLEINPNGKIPAIVDQDGLDGPISVFESGAILWYLAEKYDRFGADDPREKKALLEWLFWQTGNQGPMAGQLSHFVNYADGDHPYAHNRYLKETERTFGVLEERLRDQSYILGDYSIADMMAFPWVFIGKKLGVDVDLFPAVKDWRSRIKSRPAVHKAIDLHKDKQFTGQTSAADNKILFNQNSNVLRSGSRNHA